MDFAKNNSLQEIFLERLQSKPEGKALAFVDSAGDIHWMSFSCLYSSALDYAAVLRCSGVSAGDVCILVPENDKFSCINLMAILLIGALPLLCAPPVIRGEHSVLKDVLQNVIRKTNAKVVIANDDIAPLIESLQADNDKVNFLLGQAAFEIVNENALEVYLPTLNAIAALQLSSGTTGFPKIVQWHQKAVLAALTGMYQAMDLNDSDIFVNWTPLYHDMGLVNNFLLCMAQGIPLVLMHTFDFVKNPASWLRTLSKSGATQTWSPNFGFAISAVRVRDSQINGVRLDRVRGFWNAAERIHYDTFEDFYQRFSAYGLSKSALKTNFGMVENVGGATFSDPNGRYEVECLDTDALHARRIAETIEPAAEHLNNHVTVVSVGRPYPGMTAKILSRAGERLPDGHIGEISFNTPSRMCGYMGDEAETKKAIAGEMLRTGDFGYMRGDNIFWLGRLREKINIYGRKFDPSDFEKPLLEVKGLREGCFAAFGIDVASAGTQQLVIVAEKRRSSELPNEQVVKNIMGAVNVRLGVRPSEVLLLEEGSMTKTSSGKRRHRYYSELYKANKLQPLAGSSHNV